MSEIDKNEPTLLENIRSGYDTFSKGQKRIAGYILDNYVSAAYMTAARLSKETGVSESTVVRFATELGYEGYPEMQSALQGMLKNRCSASILPPSASGTTSSALRCAPTSPT